MILKPTGPQRLLPWGLSALSLWLCGGSRKIKLRSCENKSSGRKSWNPCFSVSFLVNDPEGNTLREFFCCMWHDIDVIDIDIDVNVNVDIDIDIMVWYLTIRFVQCFKLVWAFCARNSRKFSQKKQDLSQGFDFGIANLGLHPWYLGHCRILASSRPVECGATTSRLWMGPWR